MSPGHSIRNDPLVHCPYHSSSAAFSGFWLADNSGHGGTIAGLPLLLSTVIESNWGSERFHQMIPGLRFVQVPLGHPWGTT